MIGRTSRRFIAFRCLMRRGPGFRAMRQDWGVLAAGGRRRRARGGEPWPLGARPIAVLEDTVASEGRRGMMKISFVKSELPSAGTIVVGVLEEHRLTPTA